MRVRLHRNPQAIIDRDLFDRVRAQLSANNPKSTPPRAVNGPCLLTGLARCADCEASMTRTGTQRHGRRYSYYTCSGAHATGLPDCRDRHVKMEMLDSMVLGAVRDTLLEPTMLVRTLEELSARLNEKSGEAKAKLDRLYSLIETGVQGVDDVLRDRLATLRTERERALAAVDRAKALTSPTVSIDAEQTAKVATLQSHLQNPARALNYPVSW